MKKLIFLSSFLLLITGVNAQEESRHSFTVSCDSISSFEIISDKIYIFNTEECNANFFIEEDIITFYYSDYFNAIKEVFEIFTMERPPDRGISKYICEKTNGEEIIIEVSSEYGMVRMYNYENENDNAVFHISQMVLNYR